MEDANKLILSSLLLTTKTAKTVTHIAPLYMQTFLITFDF